jgi:hypothetical protein
MLWTARSPPTPRRRSRTRGEQRRRPAVADGARGPDAGLEIADADGTNLHPLGAPRGENPDPRMLMNKPVARRPSDGFWPLEVISWVHTPHT